MNTDDATTAVELRVTARFATGSPWVVQAIAGFLSAYFMEHPGFHVRRRTHDMESGMHVWHCDVPQTMRVPRLLKRLQQDLPPCRILPPDTQGETTRYVIDSLEA
ncbi:MAG: hypothetical protein ABL970_00480 [Nitrospira sp.]